MKKKIYKGRAGVRLFLGALLLLLVFCLPVQAQAAKKQTVRVTVNRTYKSTMEKRGSSWYLNPAVTSGNKKVSFRSVQYVQFAKGSGFVNGYYYFFSDGRLDARRVSHKLRTVCCGHKFDGLYYFGNTNGRLWINKKGWLTVNGNRYYTAADGRVYTGWNNNYYFQPNGKLLRNAVTPDGYPVNGSGRRTCVTIKLNRTWRTSLDRKTDGWYIRQPKYKYVQYVQFAKGSSFVNGFYYFDKNGKLDTRKTFHKLNMTANGTKFNGYYYFGYADGRLMRKRGWLTWKGERYCISSAGKAYTNCWVDGYYLKSDGKIARSMKTPDGQYVDGDGRKCAKSEMRLGSLKKQLQSMINGYSGTWSVYVKDLKTGDVLSINENAMYPASIIKLFVMASTYDQINRGKLQKTSYVNSLLRSMITVSDNESYNQLVRYHASNRSFVSGCSAVNSYIKKLGLKKTGCHSTLHPSSSGFASDGKGNTSSAKDAGILLEKIYRGQCVSEKYSREMLNLLLNQQVRYKIPSGVPKGIKVANKTGETSSYQHDAAIVYGPKTTYVVSIFSQTSEYNGVSGIRKLSARIYDYLN